MTHPSVQRIVGAHRVEKLCRPFMHGSRTYHGKRMRGQKRCKKRDRWRRFFLAWAILRVQNGPLLASDGLEGTVRPPPGRLLALWGTPMTASGSDLIRLIERARHEEPGALDRLLDSYRNYLRL